MKQEIVRVFREKYSTQPQLFFSPGRINLLGEHVDYNDGYVLPAAIDKGIWFALAPNDTNEARFYSVDLDDSMQVSLSHISKNEGWKNYVLGVLHVLQQAGKQIPGFDCVFGGNLPPGAGLSSSAAVECGLTYALNTVFNLGLSGKEMALSAQQAEHLFPGVKCGIMDQYACTMGKADHIIMLDCNNITHQYLPFRLNGYRLVLFNTKVHHSLASGEYNQRREQSSKGLAVIRAAEAGVNSFRDVTMDMLTRHKPAMDEVVYRRCSYVVQEIGRTKKAARLLQQDHIEAFGQLMYETHQGLSKDYEVSCPELDFLVGEARINDVTGARMMGGGFGGCTINIIASDHYQVVVNNIAKAYEAEFGFLPEIIEAGIGDGVHEVTI